MNQSLDDIKARMTKEQRQDMAEIIANEVKRREAMKQGSNNYGARTPQKSNVRSSRMSNTLPNDALGEMYSGLQDKVADLRQQKLDEKIANAKSLSRSVPRQGSRRSIAPRLFSSTSLLIFGVVTLGLAKIGLSAGVFDGLQNRVEPVAVAAPVVDEPQAPNGEAKNQTASDVGAAIAAAPIERRAGTWTEAEKQVLTELDARRVELEKRRQELDLREGEIKNQAQALSERTAELRTLVTKVSQVRKEKDNQYEARLEQLANVYSSMAPNEAAPLVGKLDEDTALELLKRMPGKRMGQILSLMDPERAVRLTKLLSEKASLNDIPAR